MACRQGFFLTIGNGGGVELRLNGKSLGVPGKAGKVVRVKVPQSAELLRVPEAQAVEDAATSVQAVPEAGESEMEGNGFDR